MKKELRLKDGGDGHWARRIRPRGGIKSFQV